MGSTSTRRFEKSPRMSWRRSASPRRPTRSRCGSSWRASGTRSRPSSTPSGRPCSVRFLPPRPMMYSHVSLLVDSRHLLCTWSSTSTWCLRLPTNTHNFFFRPMCRFLSRVTFLVAPPRALDDEESSFLQGVEAQRLEAKE
ncbi:unnamed protein product, partial [Ectocarpus sp. 12 AP-2014]